MAITFLRVADFRNFASLAISPASSGLNLIYGENGAGKTSLLEAIYYLGLGRSFKSAASKLIRQQTEHFSIFSQVVNENKPLTPLGTAYYKNGKSHLRIAEKKVD